MSIDVTNKVWLRGPQDAKQRLLLMAIADHANDKGAAYPGVELLAQKSCQSVRNALRGIVKLELEGWIIVLRRRHGERARGNEYLINLAKLADEKSLTPTRAAGNASRHDTVSHDDNARVANTPTCEPPRDTLSCGEKAPENTLHEVTESRHDMTKQASRSDKITPCIENRKEPSKEPLHPPTPQGGQVAETADPDGMQRGCWELCNRVRKTHGRKPLEWEAWVSDQKEAGFWPVPERSPGLPADTAVQRFRSVRPSRNSRASIGIYRGS